MVVRHAVLTGVPGIGKTTLVKKICTVLEEKQVNFYGFYTEEMRSDDGRERLGFQIVTTDGHTALLAHKNSKSTRKVGQYGVEVELFEKLAIPQLENIGTRKGVVVIDEIGKMELFSEQFKSAIIKAFEDPDVTILATIPIAKGKPIPFVENIRLHPSVKLFMVDKLNRNSIQDNILSLISHPQESVLV